MCPASVIRVPDPRPTGPRLGFACHWTPDRSATWSGTPSALRSELSRRTDVVDVGAELPPPVRQALRALGARRNGNRWSSIWRQDGLTQRLVERQVRAQVLAAAPDVVLQIQDLAITDVPFMVMQDLSYHLLIEHYGRHGSVPHFRALSRSRVASLQARQLGIYERAARLLPMSEWMADDLRSQGIDSDRIVVVNPGINTSDYAITTPPAHRRSGDRWRLLLVGRDFDTKGGEQVLAAFDLLRRDFGARISLTIAGPPTWPLSGEVPHGVTFLGPVSKDRVLALMDEHDLFVMPSRFEGFGIVFAEALSRGLPCIGRDACAMPEIIDAVSGGRLIRSESPEELAASIISALEDDDLYEACAAAAPDRRAHYSWSRAADQVVAAAASIGR